MSVVGLGVNVAAVKVDVFVGMQGGSDGRTGG